MGTPLDPMRGLIGSGQLQQTQNVAKTTAEQTGKTEDGKSFKDVMSEFVNQVDDAQHQFDDAIKAVENGETDNLHQVMLAQNEAQVSLKLAAEVRNKLVEAYREVMRTQF